MNKVNANCENCPVNSTSTHKRLGEESGGKYDYLVALAGNPNTGKSTVFNNLTGLRQHTGNWPGKTVSRMEGAFGFNDKNYKIVDLPGTYSLLSTSEDEEVARNFILFGRPDVTVIVVDATRLERNLNLCLQILEITPNAVLCLNLIDEAKRNNIEIDIRGLSKDLGIPVIPTSARQKEGMPELLSAIEEVASGSFITKPPKIKSKSKKLNNAIADLSLKIKKIFPNLQNSDWVALRLLEGDNTIMKAIENGDLGEIKVENE